MKSALAPLLEGAPLSKDAVSRLVGRMSEDFESWRTRDLANEEIVSLFLDGWCPKVRIGKRRERVPVLVTLGVRSDARRSCSTCGSRARRAQRRGPRSLPIS